MRRLLPFIAAAAVVAIVVIGIVQAGGKGGSGNAATRPPQRFSLPRALDQLRGAPKPLAALHERASAILTGGPAAFQKRLRALRGHPVVVNKWASWCGPCRHEFPIFERVSTARGKRIAFLGLNSGDNTADARAFLRQFPLPYPSYEDPDEKIARKVGAPAYYPITVFLDAHGKQAYIRQGGYASDAQLQRDIDRYLG